MPVFRNYLAAALRNLSRSRLYAVINALGLGIGLRRCCKVETCYGIAP